MKVKLEYGKTGLDVNFPEHTTVITPKFVEGLPDEAASFREAVRNPIAARPLGELINANDSVAVVIPDITRALPTDRLLTWLFRELENVPADNFTIINGTGSHRINTEQELISMVGKDIVAKYRIVNHDSYDKDSLALVGNSPDGLPVYLNREYVNADKRIVLGFIEPHLMSGFSGGYKGIFPAIAGIDSITHYHRASVLADPKSTYGILDGNPTLEQVRANGSLIPVDFCINVTLNRNREITRFFCGDVSTAHEAGCAFAKTTAMVECEHSYPIVVTTNSGYPLDQNLYQCCKGVSAAAQIVSPDGLIISAAQCSDGFPAGSHFHKLMIEHSSPQAFLDKIMSPGFSAYEQWGAQMLAMVQVRARVGLYSEIPADEVAAAHLEPIENIEARIQEELHHIGANAPIAVLPEGPMTIPYLSIKD